MAASVEKICPRCNIRFNCHAADIQNCPCSKIDFTEKERAQLQTNYKDFLCKNCLIALKNKLMIQSKE